MTTHFKVVSDSFASVRICLQNWDPNSREANMKLRFLHLADVFLGCRNLRLGEQALQRSDDFRAAFRTAVEFALDDANEIDGVLLAGNTFDHHRPDEDTWSFFRGLVSRLLSKNRLVVATPGFRDSYAYKHSVWRTERLPGVDLFLNTEPEAPVVHEIRGTRVFFHGLTYVPGQTPEPLTGLKVPGESGINIALLAGAVSQHPLFAEHPNRMTLDADSLGSSGLDYVALGGSSRFHEYSGSGSVVVEAGSLEGRGFEPGDLGEKGPVLVEITESGTRIERMITNRRTHSRVTLDLRDENISDASALECAIESLAGSDEVVELTLTGTAEFVLDRDEILERMKSRFFHIEIQDESGIADSGLLRKMESENTIRGYFVRKLGDRIEAARAALEKKGATPNRLRELKVLEYAMKIGVEQFVEEETSADSIYSLVPDSDEMVIEPEAAREDLGIEKLEDRVKAMIEYRRGLSEDSTEEPEEAAEAEAAAEFNGEPVSGQETQEEGR